MTSEMLYQILRARIQAGKYPVNQPMPTEANLCEEFDIARGTARAALQRLVDEGYLFAGQGRKRMVERLKPLRLEKLRISAKHHPREGERTPSFGKYLKSLGLRPADIVLRSPTRLPCSALAEEARFRQATEISNQLHIDLEDEVFLLERLRQADDEPLALQWTVVPEYLTKGRELSMELIYPGGLTDYYQDRGLTRFKVQSSYTPTRASKSEGDYLRLGMGAPLIEERRVSFFKSKTGQPVPYEYLVTLYTERVALTFDWEDVWDENSHLGRGKSRG